MRQAKAECFQEQRVGDTRRYATPGNPFTRLASAQVDSFKDDNSVDPQTQALRMSVLKLQNRPSDLPQNLMTNPFQPRREAGP